MALSSNATLRRSITALFVFFAGLQTQAQGVSDSTEMNRKKLNRVIVVSGVGYTAGLLTLNHVWYKNSERQSFRFFNDNAEWKQVDKAGHFFAAYWLSSASSTLLNGTGIPSKKADVVGAAAGFLLTVPIEILDGYSQGYGASVGDIVADAAGPAFFLGQKFLWKEIRVTPKFSFHRTGYAPQRPELLGDDMLSQIVKDYNGQTYWLSVDMDKFIKFPRWLNLAVGYGAHDMVFGRDHENKAYGFDPHRQYYFAVDFDLTCIKTRSSFVKTLLFVLNSVRLPAPAVELSRRGSRFHPIYF